MSNLDLLSKSISEMANLIRAKAVSPVDLVNAELEHISSLNPCTNSFITILSDQALQRARELGDELADGSYRGPLHGIPFAVKDNICTGGIKTTAGSKILADWVPDEDAPVVTKMKDAGAILIGKENLSEFAAGAAGANIHYGDIHNPWDLSRISGGSSGGSGANVASFQAFVSFGTDGGGSVRIPASLCGAVGLKATHGRVSLRGAIPPYVNRDHIGPITRSVEDSALVLQAVAGYDDLDPTSVPVPVPNYRAELEPSLKGLVMGIPTSYYFDLVDPEVEKAVRAAIGVLEELGVEPKEVTIDLMEHLGVGMNVDILVYHEKWIKSRPMDLDPELYFRILPWYCIRAVDYAKAERYRRLLKQEFARVMREVDFLVTPTLPHVAYPIGAESITIDRKEIGLKGPGVASKTLGRLTQASNQTGIPSITVPCGFNSQGMPIGVQLIGRPFEEELILRAAHHYETASFNGNGNGAATPTAVSAIMSSQGHGVGRGKTP